MVACEHPTEPDEAVGWVVEDVEDAEQVVALDGRQDDFVDLTGVAAFDPMGEREVGVTADPVEHFDEGAAVLPGHLDANDLHLQSVTPFGSLATLWVLSVQRCATNLREW